MDKYDTEREFSERKNLAQIEYMPWKKIVVHEIKEMEVPDFLMMVVSQFEAQKQIGDPGVDWVEGIAFVRGDFPDTQEVIQEKLNGVLHYGMVSFTKTSFEERKKVLFNGRDRFVRLMKGDKNPDFVNLCRFLGGFKSRDVASSTIATNPAV